MGLPGSGKTTLSLDIKNYLESKSRLVNMSMEDFLKCEVPPDIKETFKVDWFNADEIRKKYNDWDFSNDGRIRQSLRMLDFAIKCNGDFVICDFVAPLPEMRTNFKADITIWVDTIKEGRFEDTNKLFVPPDKWDFRVTEKDSKRWAKIIVNKILK